MKTRTQLGECVEAKALVPVRTYAFPHLGFLRLGLDMRLRRHLHDPEHIERREDESSYRERVEDSSASLDPDARGSGIQPEAHQSQADAAYPIRTPASRDLDSLCGLGSPFAPKPSVLLY
jgi:hypothetical protein